MGFSPGGNHAAIDEMAYLKIVVSVLPRGLRGTFVTFV
jgi:hypothetical protein